MGFRGIKPGNENSIMTPQMKAVFKDNTAVKKHTRFKAADAMMRRAIVTDFAKGLTEDEISEKIQANAYGIGYNYTKGYAQKIINRAKEWIIQEYDEKTLHSWRPKLLANYMNLYEECRNENDRANAIKILKEVGMMIGAYDQVETKTQSNTINISFGFDAPNLSQDTLNEPEGDKVQHQINPFATEGLQLHS